MPHKPTVAAFDFDGTITYRDTTFPFLLFLKGFWKTAYLLTKKIPTLIAFLFGRANRQETKESIFHAFFSGESLETLRKKGELFARTKLPSHVRKKALERIQWHQAQGHRLLLVSASLDLYLEPWAASCGFEKVLSSKLAEHRDGTVNGKLEGLNCRKEEKVRRLQEYLGPLSNYRLYAYGDSDGDEEMLEAADVPFYRIIP